MWIAVLTGVVVVVLAWGLWFDRKRGTRGIADRRDAAMTDTDIQAQAESMVRRDSNGPDGFGSGI
jgi:hypothetical protein